MHTIRSRTRIARLVMLLTCAASTPTVFAQSLETQLRPLVDEIISGCSQAGAKRITVADFADLQGQVTDFGRYIAEELGVSLVMSKPKFGLVDRANLRTILAEHKLSMSGLVNPDTAKKLGQIAGVDGIVTGTITPLGDSYRLTIKVIATEIADVMAAARADIARTPAIEAVATNKRQVPDDSPQGSTLGKGSGVGGQGTRAASAAGTPANSSVASNASSVAGSARLADFVIGVRQCRQTDDTEVVCEGFATNRASRPRRLRFYPQPQLIDDLGNEARSNKYSFGSGRRRIGLSRNDEQVLESEVPVNFTVSATGLDPRAQSVTLVFGFQYEGQHYSERPRASVRNVPIEH